MLAAWMFAALPISACAVQTGSGPGGSDLSAESQDPVAALRAAVEGGQRVTAGAEVYTVYVSGNVANRSLTLAQATAVETTDAQGEPPKVQVNDAFDLGVVMAAEDGTPRRVDRFKVVIDLQRWGLLMVDIKGKFADVTISESGTGPSVDGLYPQIPSDSAAWTARMVQPVDSPDSVAKPAIVFDAPETIGLSLKTPLQLLPPPKESPKQASSVQDGSNVEACLGRPVPQDVTWAYPTFERITLGANGDRFYVDDSTSNAGLVPTAVEAGSWGATESSASGTCREVFGPNSVRTYTECSARIPSPGDFWVVAYNAQGKAVSMMLVERRSGDLARMRMSASPTAEAEAERVASMACGS